jgi:hypothetical protein
MPGNRNCGAGGFSTCSAVLCKKGSRARRPVARCAGAKPQLTRSADDAIGGRQGGRQAGRVVESGSFLAICFHVPWRGPLPTVTLGGSSVFLVRSSRDDHERIRPIAGAAAPWLVPWRPHPDVALFIVVRMMGIASDESARRPRSATSSENRRPLGAGDRLRLRAAAPIELGPEAGERKQRPAFAQREPDDVLFLGFRIWLRSVLGEAVGRHQAAVLWLQPAAPVRRLRVADVVTGGPPVFGGMRHRISTSSCASPAFALGRVNAE